MSAPLSDTELVEELVGSLSCLLPACPARAGQLGECDEVLASSEERHEIHRLEHEPDAIATEASQSLGVVTGDVLAPDHDDSVGGSEESACDRDQSRLARSRRADERDHLVVADGQLCAVQCDDLFFAGAVDLSDVAEFERAHECLLGLLAGRADGGDRIGSGDAAK